MASQASSTVDPQIQSFNEEATPTAQQLKNNKTKVQNLPNKTKAPINPPWKY